MNDSNMPPTAATRLTQAHERGHPHGELAQGDEHAEEYRRTLQMGDERVDGAGVRRRGQLGLDRRRVGGVEEPGVGELLEPGEGEGAPEEEPKRHERPARHGGGPRRRRVPGEALTQPRQRARRGISGPQLVLVGPLQSDHPLADPPPGFPRARPDDLRQCASPRSPAGGGVGPEPRRSVHQAGGKPARTANSCLLRPWSGIRTTQATRPSPPGHRSPLGATVSDGGPTERRPSAALGFWSTRHHSTFGHRGSP